MLVIESVPVIQSMLVILSVAKDLLLHFYVSGQNTFHACLRIISCQGMTLVVP